MGFCYRLTSSGLPSDIKTMFSTIYGDVSGIFTLICIVALSICFLGMLLCKDARKVEDFHQWRNRIFVTWIVFNILGSIAKYGENLTKNLNYKA